MVFVEEPLAAFEEVDVCDAGFSHRLPAWLAGPPVAPEVKIAPPGVFAALFCISNSRSFTMKFIAAAFAQIIPGSRRHIHLFAHAAVCFVITGTVGSSANNSSVLDNDGSAYVFYRVVRTREFLSSSHQFVVFSHVQYRFARGNVRIGDGH